MPQPASATPIAKFASDRDETLTDHSVTWSSSLDGDLGTGNVLEITAAQLSEGTHTITATVRDSQGAESTDTITLEVFRVAPPPPSADLRVTGAAPSGATIGGDDATLDVTVASSGPSTARNLQVKVEPDAGLQARVPTALDAWIPRWQGAGCSAPARRCPRTRARRSACRSARRSPTSGSAAPSRSRSSPASPIRGWKTTPHTSAIVVDPRPPAGGGGGGGGGPAPSGGGATGGGPAQPGGPAGAASAGPAKGDVAKRLRTDVKAYRGLVAALRRRGAVTVEITFLVGGTHRLTLQTTGRRPVVIATGNATATKAGKGKLKLKVTRVAKIFVINYFFNSQLIIQLIPYLSVSIPNLAPQNVSCRGIVICPPCERLLKYFSVFQIIEAD